MTNKDSGRTPGYYNEHDVNNLPGTLGIRSIEIGNDYSIAEMKLQTKHMNLRKSIHGGAVVTLADTTAGYGTFANLPHGADGFTTIELKCNFIRPAKAGTTLRSTGKCIHNGRTTQVWDATVIDMESENTIAEFRCTNMILYPGSNPTES